MRTFYHFSWKRRSTFNSFDQLDKKQNEDFIQLGGVSLFKKLVVSPSDILHETRGQTEGEYSMLKAGEDRNERQWAKW